MADRLPVKLANESALGVYRFSWTSADGARMEVQWGAGMGNPLVFRRDAAREIVRPERFGWKTPEKAADFRRFAQAVADEFEAGYDDGELAELQARTVRDASAEPGLEDRPSFPGRPPSSEGDGAGLREDDPPAATELSTVTGQPAVAATNTAGPAHWLLPGDRRVTVGPAGDGSWGWGLRAAGPLPRPGAPGRLRGGDGFAGRAAAIGNARAVLGRDGIVLNRAPVEETSVSEPEVIPEPAQAEMAGEWRHLRQDHGADPATVARDAPGPEMAGLIHDAAHEYPDAPWGELVVRGQAEGWWQARDWERESQPKEDPAEWRAFFREFLGLDMPLNAAHEARLNQLDAAELLTRDMWANGPDGSSCLHGFDPAALAAERGGLSFPHLYQQWYIQLNAGPRAETAQAGPSAATRLNPSPAPGLTAEARSPLALPAAAAFPAPPAPARPAGPRPRAAGRDADPGTARDQGRRR